MRRLRDLRFRQQLILLFVAGSVLVTLIGSFTASNFASNLVERELRRQGLNITRTLGQNAKLAMLYESTEAAADAAQSVAGFSDVQVLEIRAASGALLYRDATGPDLPGEEALPPAGYLEVDTPGSWVFRLEVRAERADEQWGPGADAAESEEPERLGEVTLALHKRTQHELAQRILFGILGTSSLAAVLLLLFLIEMSRRITRPLEGLAQAMRRAEHGDLAARADLPGGQADIQEMQHAFNAMMDQLQNREQELHRARDVAVEAARLKGEFAANVTHELRTPMNGVLGLLDLLRDTRLGVRQVEYIDLARKSAEALLSLIDNILDFSRNDSGVIRSAIQEVIFRDLLEETVNLIGTQALSKGIDIGYFMAPEVPAVLSLDAPKLKQVLINLLGNAVKFTEAGEVFLRVALAGEDDRRLRFEVSDTGIGIDPEQRGRIFEPFTQVDASSSKRYQGTGLGLTICRQLVDLMGGAIGVESAVGQGSTFWFEVPFVAAQARIPPPQAAEPGLRDQAVCVLGSARQFVFVADTLRRQHLGCVHAADMQAARLQLERIHSSGQLPLAIVDDAVYFDHRDEFDTLAARGAARVCVLLNPFGRLKIAAGWVETLEKPVLFAPLARLVSQPPAAAAPPVPEPESDAWKPAFAAQSRVLLVEDNPVNQQVAAEMLARLGVAADLAEHGEQALALAARTGYDLILMDCNMPVMDGYAATRQIRELEADRQIPIIAMTAAIGDEERERALAAGFTDFLHKPVRLEALRALLARWIPAAAAQPEAETGAGGVREPGAAYSAGAMQELHDSVGDVTYRMVESFLEDTPVYLDSLKSALLENDARRVYEIAHALKGSASNFGAAPFLAVVGTLEAQSKAGDLAQAGALVNACEARFAELRKELELYQLSEAGHRASAQRKHQLLIADDDRTLRLALRGTFASDEFEILEAADGAQAIALCERAMPDVILIDAMMPEVNGFDACQRIRQLPGGADLPILVITSLDDEDAIVRAFRCGATDYLTKPIHFTVLKERVGRLIKANRAEVRARTLAFADSLTGLPNRARLNQELGFALNQASLNSERVAVLFLDLDNFKNVNDTLGHQVGDLLLKAVADRLRRCVRRSDFIARLGGDEFTVILRRAESDEIISHIAGNILEALSEPFVFIQKRMLVSTSIGISVFPDHGEDVSSLLKHADLAMFKAKETKNRFCFYTPGMEDAVSLKLQLQQELRQALDNDHFLLYLQPQYDLHERRAVAAEALVRWRREDGKILTAGNFIPLAEEAGLITELTDLVLEKACLQIRTWLDRGYAVRLAVNLSGRDFAAPGRLFARVSDLTRKYGVPPRLLELEITESLLMADPERSREELLELKNAGFSLSIDDFGSGYSSLFYLKNLPVDVLKIDRAFIKDLGETGNRRDIPVITGIIALARSLGLHTVAEGVETEHQKEVIESLGCEMIQGYLVSEPLPAAEFERRFLPDFAAESAKVRS
jgi:diguanylate cyclase (GGDEF)-like protein